LIKFDVRLRAVGLATFGWSQIAVLGPDVQFAKKSGIPYIPGSSLKGALRSAASRIAECYGFKTCGEIRPEKIGLCSCDVCQLFGKPNSLPSPLMVGDMELEGEKQPFPVTRVRLEDRTMRAEEGGLYTQEHLCWTEFKGKMIVRPVEKKLLGLLLLSMAELRTGRVGRDTIVDLKLEDTEHLRNEIKPEWIALLNELEKWLWEERYAIS